MTVFLASELDDLLTAQFAVAWAGEGGGDPARLGWWPTDMVSENGGHDLFQRLLPQTWAWASLQTAREAARRCDARLRAGALEADNMISLFHLGFEADERVEERLRELKRSERAPTAALPGLRSVLRDTWNRDLFSSWLSGHGEPRYERASSHGRLIPGAPPQSLDVLASQFLAALLPLPEQREAYPLPYFLRRPK